MLRSLNKPALHFVAIGAALFALNTWRGTSPAAGERIVITATRVEQLRNDLIRQTGTPPTVEEEAALIEREIEEELLYRTALASGLDRGDRNIQRRLITKMRLLALDASTGKAALYQEALELGLQQDDIIIRRILIQKMRRLASMNSDTLEPTETELRDYLERKREHYLQPARVSLAHVFLSPEGRGPALQRDARALLVELRSGSVPPQRANEFGDPFPAGPHPAISSQHELAKLFGAQFAQAVFALEPGLWSAPIRSAYGFHIVFIERKEPARPSSLEAVRARVRGELLSENRESRYREALRELRERYAIQIESSRRPRGGEI